MSQAMSLIEIGGISRSASVAGSTAQSLIEIGGVACSAVSQAAQAVGTAVVSAAKAVGGVFSGLWKTVKSAVCTVGGWVFSAAKAVVSTVNTVIGKAAGVAIKTVGACVVIAASAVVVVGTILLLAALKVPLLLAALIVGGITVAIVVNPFADDFFWTECGTDEATAEQSVRVALCVVASAAAVFAVLAMTGGLAAVPIFYVYLLAFTGFVAAWSTSTVLCGNDAYEGIVDRWERDEWCIEGCIEAKPEAKPDVDPVGGVI